MAVYHRRSVAHFVLRLFRIFADLMGGESKSADPILLTVGASPIFNGADENISHPKFPPPTLPKPKEGQRK
jgi:hypothetical protein